MTSYVVTYDLNGDEDSSAYKPLINEIKRLGGHKYQFSAWLINVSNTAEELHDHLKKLMDKDDSLWVSEMVKNRHCSGAKAGTNNWIKENPASR
ncbi:CRISPR-associated protein Cas2 [Sinorhizobium medicae]|uniref:CRISPR-associated protein Cas2 n=1 Tax=Sinorhizobium medicae TaxID=110321 RepID=UPI0018657723|nr:CRISPR-associated protein Cas2 [Sinorhizobium medicae]